MPKNTRRDQICGLSRWRILSYRHRVCLHVVEVLGFGGRCFPTNISFTHLMVEDQVEKVFYEGLCISHIDLLMLWWIWFQPLDKSGSDSEDPQIQRVTNTSNDCMLFYNATRADSSKKRNEVRVLVWNGMAPDHFLSDHPELPGLLRGLAISLANEAWWSHDGEIWWMCVEILGFGIEVFPVCSCQNSNTLQIVNYRFGWDVTFIIQWQLFDSSSAFVWPVAEKMEADPFASIVMSFWEGNPTQITAKKEFTGSLVGKLPWWVVDGCVGACVQQIKVVQQPPMQQATLTPEASGEGRL